MQPRQGARPGGPALALATIAWPGLKSTRLVVAAPHLRVRGPQISRPRRIVMAGAEPARGEGFVRPAIPSFHKLSAGR